MGAGEGDLLNVSIDMVEKCDLRVGTPLASGTINLAVHTSGEQATTSWQAKKKVGLIDLSLFGSYTRLLCTPIM